MAGRSKLDEEKSRRLEVDQGFSGCVADEGGGKRV